MWRATIKGLLARKLRLLTTSLAVLLGVAFMSGTLVLTDTIGKTFDDVFADVFEGTDAYVRGEAVFEADFDTDFGGNRPRLDDSLVETVAAVPGVAAAEGDVQGYAQLIDKEGEPVGNPDTGAPTFGGNWGVVDELNPFDLVEGSAPENDGQVVLDAGTIDETGYEVGDRARVLTKAGLTEVEISGVARFGQTDSPGGASFVLFTLERAQELVAEPGKLDAVIAAAEDGVSEDELTARIAEVVPPRTEVLTGTEITEENQSDLEEAIGFFRYFLLVFAVVALLVGSFIIYNTFSIIVAQRTREMALFRAIGASRRQVLGSVLVESVVVGLVAGVLGLVAGVGVAAGLKSLLTSIGIDIPASGIVLTTNTIIVSMLTGLVVSVLSAFFPARRAAQVPPIAAMRDVALDTSSRSPRRIVVGVVITAVAVAGLVNGLVGGGGPASVGAGAVGIFLGVAVLGPVIARPASRLLGAPLPALRGMPGTLARANAMRNPRRTSATAAALMIGVGLVVFITIFAASTKASIDDIVSDAFTGDMVIDSGSFGFGGLPPELAEQVDALPEVEAATGFRFAAAQIDGSTEALVGADPRKLARIVDVGVVDGSLEALDATAIAVNESVADDKGLAVGDTVTVRFGETGEQELTVQAIYSEDELAGNWFVGLDVLEANVADQFDLQVLIELADGVSVEEARPIIAEIVDEYPTAELQDVEEFIDSQSSFIDPLLNLIYVLLALAVFIAVLGIINTLALSIYERTRELGLLRAVGMTRSQMRSTVRWESVIIALLGTLLGLVIGLFLGWVMVQALKDEGFRVFRVPLVPLVVIGVVAALVGVLAAILPARRAARLDVLEAISTE